MDTEPRISHRFAIYIHNYLLDIGVDPEPLFKSCDINFPITDIQDTSLPLYAISSLMEKSAQHCNDPYIGLHIAQRLHYESSGIMILTMLAAPNVEEGIKSLCNYDKYVDNGIETNLKIEPSISTFTVKLLNPRIAETHQLSEFLIILFVDMLNKGTRMNMPIQEVKFSHSSSKDITPLREFLRAKVTYVQEEN
ncbi:MAG: AraC family transcriptional regulator, partial [Gammaproteobacteria bacterium]|nr:AraC family transcriptional regulator [Gammaproteobacteria bacterium]